MIQFSVVASKQRPEKKDKSIAAGGKAKAGMCSYREVVELDQYYDHSSTLSRL